MKISKINCFGVLFLTLLMAGASAQQKYNGPPPPKKDIPYLVHADNLIATEITAASCQSKKDVATCIVKGDKSPARTPLASPSFVMDSDRIGAGKLQLYQFTIKNGHREVVINHSGKGSAKPLIINITKASGTLYQIEVVDSLAPGEYSLTPNDSDDAFCFEVF